MARVGPERPGLPDDAKRMWDSCPTCHAGFPCERAYSAVLSDRFELRLPDPMAHAWPWTDRVTKMMCYAHRNTCALRDCMYLHEYRGQLCLGKDLHVQFIRMRRGIQRLVAGHLSSTVNALEIPAPPLLEAWATQCSLLDQCDFWQAILEDCQYIGMLERILYLDEWQKQLLSGESRWQPPANIQMPNVVRCVNELRSNIQRYKEDCIGMKDIFFQCRLKLSGIRSWPGHTIWDEVSGPIKSMPASYWLARHHIACMRESRMFASNSSTITSGMHWDRRLFCRCRSGMPAWNTFHLGLLSVVWPLVRKPGHLKTERYGILKYFALPDEDEENEPEDSDCGVRP